MIVAFIEANPAKVRVYYCPRASGDVWIQIAQLSRRRIGVRCLGCESGKEITCFEPKSKYYRSQSTRGCEYRGTLEKMLRGG